MIGISENILIDWLSFTLPHNKASMERALSLGDAHKSEKLDYGRFGYNNGYKILDSGWVFYHNEKPEMGIHVVLNSASLALLNYRPLQLINFLRDWGAKFTRCDLALDDYGGLLDIDEIYGKLLYGEVQTRFRKVKRVEGGDLGELSSVGKTVNIGQRSSESFLRIYDKRAERMSKGVSAEALPAHWVRVELELKGKKVVAFLTLLGNSALDGASGASELVAQLLYGLLDFKEENKTESNKSRWKTCEWWAEFIGQTTKLTLVLPVPTKSVETAKTWVYNQVKTTLAMIVLSEIDANGNSGYDFIVKCLIDGEARMSKAQQDRLDEYNTKQKRLL